MSGQLAQRTQENAAANREMPSAEIQVREAIKRRLPTIKALLPDVLDERKLAALVVTEVYKTPALAACSEESLIGCVLRAAALGLQFGQDLGQAYLIPRDRDCTLQIGYKGVVALALRSGAIKSLTTRSVYACDKFEFEYGLNERLFHKPGPAELRTAENLTYAYATVHYTNGGHDFEVLSRDECLARKARGKGAQPAWQTDFAKMCEKSAILAMRARLPLTTEVATALAQDGAAITVSSRGPAALEAHHDPAALEPPRVVEPETGEVLAPPDDQPTDPAPTRPEEPIGSDAGQEVHKALGRLKLPAPLHVAIVLRASKGRTIHASELRRAEADLATGKLAKDCATEPTGFAEATLTAWTVDTPERTALATWLDSQTAEPS